MNEFFQIEFLSVSNEQKDILIAKLMIEGYAGFEEIENCLKAFIPIRDYDENILKEISRTQKVAFDKTIIDETNWNKVWESNFEPVVIDDFVSIRADFHLQPKGVEHDIIITPKMSFGTGHHATTFLMIRQMRQIDFKNKNVLDFGTGTGVLAILSEKLGARNVVAIDNDTWSIENATENIQRNQCNRINLQKAEIAATHGSFNIILANINKNVILQNFHLLAEQLTGGGVLLLSGLLAEDEDDIFLIKDEYSLQLKQTTVRDNWLCLKFSC